VRELEPEVRAVRALLSPSTGIVDGHGLMASFRRDAAAHGAHVQTLAPVRSGRVTPLGFELQLGGGEPVTIACRALVNAAGLRAPSVSRSIAGLARAPIPEEYFAKGHYFMLGGRAPFRRLVYPVPVPGGLGIHVTLDLGGQVRFGPDVSWVSRIDYGFDTTREAAFSAAIRGVLPGACRRQARARVHGHPAEARPGRYRSRLLDSGAGRDRRRRFRCALRHRVARPHGFARDCRARSRVACPELKLEPPDPARLGPADCGPANLAQEPELDLRRKNFELRLDRERADSEVI
jgi:hypothetical protein